MYACIMNKIEDAYGADSRLNLKIKIEIRIAE